MSALDRAEASSLDLLRRARQACDAGRARPARAAPDGFDRRLDEAIAARVPLEEQMLMRVSSGARARALSAARKGQLDLCAQALGESRAVLASPRLSAEGRLVVESFHQAVEAYLDYRRGDLDGATARVLAAMRLDGVLTTRYGYDILELHRIQLAHNLLRIAARAGRPRRAAEIGAGLLAYLEGSVAAWPVPERPDGGSPDRLPAELVAAMALQITGELALLFGGRARDEAAEWLAPLAPHAAGTATPGCSRHPVAHLFLRAKQAFLAREVPAFLALAADLLEQGPDASPRLFQAVAADLDAVAAELDAAAPGTGA